MTRAVVAAGVLGLLQLVLAAWQWRAGAGAVVPIALAGAAWLLWALIARHLRALRAPLGRWSQAAAVFDSTHQGMLVTDAQGTVQVINSAFERLTGFSADELIGRNPRYYQSKQHDAGFYRVMWSSLASTGQWQGEIWNRNKAGELYPTWQNISAVTDASGTVTHYVGVLTDIRTIKEAQARLEHLAHHDALTGLPNRLFLDMTLPQAVSRAARHHHRLALLMIDLDHFKQVNDTFGHTAGDALLQAVAQRLRDSVREADTVARLGGDEFVVLLDQVSRTDDPARVASKVIAAVGAPLALSGQVITPSCSVGIALYPDHAVTPENLVRLADAALYRAKQNGRHTQAMAASPD